MNCSLLGRPVFLPSPQKFVRRSKKCARYIVAFGAGVASWIRGVGIGGALFLDVGQFAPNLDQRGANLDQSCTNIDQSGAEMSQLASEV